MYEVSLMKAQQYLDNLTSEGKISFTKEALQFELGLTTNAAHCVLRRLKQKKQIVSPAKGYYLILTPEFRHLGCLPPDFFIDDLMKHLKIDYYVALLSAALYYGAAHQQPQIFQVMIPGVHPMIQCGRVKIQFIKNKFLHDSITTVLKTRTGYMKISTPEATAKDLLTFIRQSGGIGQIATVIDELTENLNAEKLQAIALQDKQYQWVQRLGYLLDTLGYTTLSNNLYSIIENKKLRTIPLVPHRKMTGSVRNKKWRLAENTVIESDLHDDTY